MLEDPVPERQDPPIHIPQLDGIRGIAILMVMAFHFFQNLPETVAGSALLHHLTRVSVWGQTGVDLFFVLSGFLITRILLQTRNEKGYFQNFYARRVLRIFPLYYGFLVFVFLLAPIPGWLERTPLSNHYSFWFYLQNFGIAGQEGPGHFWSLAVEEHFYLFWPLLIYYLDRSKAIRASIVIIGIAVVTRILFVLQDREVFYFTVTRLDALAMGTLLALVEPIGLRRFRHVFVRAFSIVAPLLAATWIFATGHANPAVQVIKFTLIAIAYAAFIGYASTDVGPLRSLLTQKPLRYVGKISYGMYVVHPLCYSVVFQFSGTTSVSWLAAICLFGTLAVASVVYYLYELPFLRLKRYFEHRQVQENLVTA